MKVYNDIDDFIIEKFPYEFQKNVKKKKTQLETDVEEATDEFNEKLSIILDKKAKPKTEEEYKEAAEDIFKIVGPLTAKEKINEGIKKFPSSKILFDERAFYFYVMEQYQEAIDDYSEVIRIDQNYADAYNSRACAYIFIKKFDEALIDVNKAIKLNPKEACYFDTRANVYKEKKQFDKALKDYNKAIKMDDTDDEHFFNRGDLYQKMGNMEAAKADFETAVKLAPDKEKYKKRLEEL